MIGHSLSLFLALLLGSPFPPTMLVPKKRPPDVVGTPRVRVPGKVLFRGRQMDLAAARAILAAEKAEAERRREEAKARIAARRAEAEKRRQRERDKAEARALWARYSAPRGSVDVRPRVPIVWNAWDGRAGWWPCLPLRVVPDCRRHPVRLQFRPHPRPRTEKCAWPE